MEKEWFNGFVANGLQFRLDGYKINIQGITYHICVKNISGSEIEIDNKIYFRFDGKRVLKRNAAGQTSKDMNWLGRRYGIMIACVI